MFIVENAILKKQSALTGEAYPGNQAYGVVQFAEIMADFHRTNRLIRPA